MDEPLVFDLSSVDWDDPESVRRAGQRIWEIAAAQFKQDDTPR